MFGFSTPWKMLELGRGKHQRNLIFEENMKMFIRIQHQSRVSEKEGEERTNSGHLIRAISEIWVPQKFMIFEY